MTVRDIVVGCAAAAHVAMYFCCLPLVMLIVIRSEFFVGRMIKVN